MATITTTALRGRWHGSDRWLTDGGARGAGRLTARITRDGVLLYFQYFNAGKLERVPLGPYDEAGDRGLSLLPARKRAAELAALHRSGITDLKGHIEREREAAERARRAEEETARRAAENAQRGTLRQLLDAYVAHLVRQGKQSAKDVRSIFTTHVLKVAPDLAGIKAADVPADEYVRLIGKVVEAGHGRTAGKLRSYLRAAYQLAIESKTDPDAPLTLRTYGITLNPIASIGALSRYNRARTRVLSVAELKAFLLRLDTLEVGPQSDALRLLLLLGGQRPAQLLRARPADVDLSAATVTIYDKKGARTEARQHVVPLLKDSAALLKRRLESLAEGEPVFSTDTRACMRLETISTLVSDIAGEMVKAQEARERFQLRDVRRTCETMLASLGVSKDIRAQLQSHGLGGVQGRHYDRHDYMLEKRQALEKWARHLERVKAGKTADVVQLGRRRVRDEAHQ
ncbi:MAG TPA: tyrosine-type recombinase/integrase [Steroidobacteraceae bacterium]|nr:tyrosine-type recombinase/integrase [Steroidobacteraceae bacterium]